MALNYNDAGNLEPGIHDLTLEEVKTIFCISERRRRLFKGIELAVAHLRKIGCKTIYLDGSFVTGKYNPRDFDLCWDNTGFDMIKAKQQCADLFNYGWKNEAIKQFYGGDVMPMNSMADEKKGLTFYGYFTQTKGGGWPKGIIRIAI